MKNIKDKTVYWTTSEGVQYFSDLLKKGKIVVGPSDTVLGLYALPSQEGFLRLNELKNRCKKPYLLLVKDWQTACEYGNGDQLLRFKKLLDTCWPGPLTVVVKAKQGLPVWCMSEQGTVALRIPRHPQLTQTLSEIPALFSTSANLAGGSIPLVIDDVAPSILEGVDAIVVDESTAQVATTTPSTIIDISSGDLVVIREGAYTWEELNELVENQI